MENEEKSMMNSMSKEMGGMMLMRLAVAVVFIVGGMFLYRMWVVTPALPDDLGNGEIKAVFLDNGQAYFGKISSANKDFLIIDKPYYLQKQTVLQEPVQDGQEPKTKQQLSLTALGGKGLQIHGPERSMYVPWDTVLYIENLRDDSEVVKLITNDTTTDTPTDTTNTNAANTNTAQ